MLMAQLWAQSGGTPPQEAGETESVSAIYSSHVALGQSIGLRASSSISGLTPTWLPHLGHSGIRGGNGHGSLFPRIPMLFMPSSVFVDSKDPQKGFDWLFHWRGLEERHLQEVQCFPVTLSSTPAFPLQSLHPGSQATDWLTDRYVTS